MILSLVSKNHLRAIAIYLTMASATAIAAEKLQVFILSGQSNMVGHANSYLLANLMNSPRSEDAALAKLVIADYQQTLKTVKPKIDALQRQIDGLVESSKNTNDDESNAKVDALANEIRSLLESVRYNEGNKVRITAFGEVDRAKRATGISGPLRPGYGANAQKIGPEYGFGMAMESELDSPTLLIKVSWGGIDLDSGFRPPSSKKIGNEPKPSPAPGPKYQELIQQVHKVLSNLETHHPDYDPSAGYEIAGFFWFQGFNDQFGDKPSRYKEHMANFICDIRSEFKTPDLPFVIGVIGTAAISKKADYTNLSHAEAVELGKMETADHAIAQAQRETAALPEFSGTVMAVESYPYYDYAILPLYHVWKDRLSEWQNVGSDRPYHYLGSARFFARFGHACGTSMIQLKKQTANTRN
ncbi:MAG: sialate O-acetylesterase [Luteolibacter sp.]